MHGCLNKGSENKMSIGKRITSITSNLKKNQSLQTMVIALIMLGVGVLLINLLNENEMNLIAESEINPNKFENIINVVTGFTMIILGFLVLYRSYRIPAIRKLSSIFLGSIFVGVAVIILGVLSLLVHYGYIPTP